MDIMKKLEGSIRKCENCKYFEAYPDVPGKDDNENAQDGDCRRYPPSHFEKTGDGLIWFSPQINKDHWCGEYQPKGPTDERL